MALRCPRRSPPGSRPAPNTPPGRGTATEAPHIWRSGATFGGVSPVLAVVSIQGGVVAEQPVAPARVDFTHFVAARGQSLQRTAYLLTGDWALAEDLLQTALARVYPRWSRIANDDPEAYIRKAIVNTWSSWWRRKWRGEVPTGDLRDKDGIDPYADVDRRRAVSLA